MKAREITLISKCELNIAVEDGLRIFAYGFSDDTIDQHLLNAIAMRLFKSMKMRITPS